MVTVLICSSAVSARTITEIDFLITYLRVPVSYFCGIPSAHDVAEDVVRLSLSLTINLAAVMAYNFSSNPQTLITSSLLSRLVYSARLELVSYERVVCLLKNSHKSILEIGESQIICILAIHIYFLMIFLIFCTRRFYPDHQ